MIRIDFDAQPIFAQLEKADAALSDLTPVHREVAEYMVEATRRRFLRGEAPDGTRWRAKSPTTLAANLRRGDGKRPDPLIGPSGRLGREIRSFVTRDSAEIGSSLEYSGVMQRGAKKGAFGTTKSNSPVPWGDIPARPWLGISAEDERNILDIVAEHLDEAIGG